MSKSTITSRFPGYPYVVFNEREDEVLNLMILSKYPLNAVRTFYFPNSYNSVSDNATSSLADKLKLVIANAESRNQQADFLSADIESYGEGNVIVCGDFNSPLFGYSCQTVAKGMRDATCLSPLSLVQSSYVNISFLPKIDQMFYKGSVECEDYDLIEGGWTDHKMQKGLYRIK